MSDNMQLALNSAIDQRRQWLATLSSRLSGPIDAKRAKAWQEYGYPTNLDFDDFYRLYERHGVGHGAVQRLLEKCWETDPWVIQGDEWDEKRPATPWEESLRLMFKRLQLWDVFTDGDRPRMVGHYSGLLLQVADGQRWDQPLIPKRGLLFKVIPAWEGQLKPTSWDENPDSPGYGQPSMWEYQEDQVRENEEAAPGRVVQIHPSRVVILGDVRDGVPFLKAGYNDCVNIEKILGGTGESYLKNAARQVAVEYDKDVDLGSIAQAHGVSLTELQQLFNDQARRLNIGNDVLMVLQGGKANPLVANVPDPEPPFNVSLASFAASVQIPVKVLVGMQTGERASTEDIRDFNKRGQQRRLKRLAPDVHKFVTHLIHKRLIDAPPGAEFTVMWDDLSESTQQEKLDNATKMAEINAKMLASGAPVFTVEEIREAAGYDNEAPEPVLPDVDPDDQSSVSGA